MLSILASCTYLREHTYLPRKKPWKYDFEYDGRPFKYLSIYAKYVMLRNSIIDEQSNFKNIPIMMNHKLRHFNILKIKING